MSAPRVFLSPLTGRAYYSSDYREDPPGRFTAASKADVTETVVHELMALAWARGWNECNAAAEGAAPPNPYRPAPTSRPDIESPERGAGGVVSGCRIQNEKPTVWQDEDGWHCTQGDICLTCMAVSAAFLAEGTTWREALDVALAHPPTSLAPPRESETA